MTSGINLKPVLLLGIWMLVSTLCVQAGELEQLMQSMSQVTHSFSHYEEDKELALLEAPISSHGTLEYFAPDRLVRTVLAPVSVRYIIDGQFVIEEKNAQSIKRRLDGLPLLQSFVASIRATLAGDLASLEKHYDVQFSSTWQEWKLTLLPLKAPLKNYISAVTLSGREDQILIYLIEDANGDMTRMRLYRDHEK